MAWAALIPVALQLLKGEEKQAPSGPAMPPPPSLGDLYKDNMQSTQPTPFQFQPSQAGPVGGKRGF